MARKLAPDEKPISWVRSSKKDFMTFPKEVQAEMGNALGVAQFGGKHPSAKPLKGLGSGLFEVVEDYDGNTYRAAYTVQFKELIYVLHAFQKKAKKGIATPKPDIELIKRRLKDAMEDHKARFEKKG
jgi:phage-related protein